MFRNTDKAKEKNLITSITSIRNKTGDIIIYPISIKEIIRECYNFTYIYLTVWIKWTGPLKTINEQLTQYKIDHVNSSINAENLICSLGNSPKQKSLDDSIKHFRKTKPTEETRTFAKSFYFTDTKTKCILKR